VHYWNKDNFEGLSQLASALDGHALLSPLAEYCRAREQGLRRQALSVLDAFLDSTGSWSDQSARSACQTLLELHARTPHAHQFLTQPLLARFILPTLDQWLLEIPDSQVALRWLGILRRDRLLLERALALEPADIAVRRLLVDWLLSDVEHATHHLVESRLLGELEPTRRSLADALALVQKAPDASSFTDLAQEIGNLDALLADWEAFSRSAEVNFPDWCSKHGRSYVWPKISYYRA
jgi:hypothetical protein